MYYTTTNPCFSCCAPPTVTGSPCKPGDCICFCDIYVSPKSDDATPCGVEGSLDLTTFPNDVQVCGENTVKYQLMMFDTAFFSSVAVSEAGVITWTPLNSSPTVTGNLVFKVYCGQLAKLVTMTIGRKSNCSGVSCPPGQICNDCSGECVPSSSGTVDLVTTVD